LNALTLLRRYMCARLRVVPAASKATVSKSVASSSQSPDKGLSMVHTNSSTGLHRSLSRDAGLPPEVFALLPEPSLIVEILSEVVLHQGVSRESSGAIMSIMATLLHR
jgi:hypothetical protein